MRYWIETLGCPKNHVDSEKLAGLLVTQGYEPALNAEEADLVVANTCAFIEEARAIYRWFMPLLELDIHPKLVQYIKLAAAATGIGSEQVRAPRLPLEGTEREQVLAVIRKGLDTRPKLPDYLNI